jgi:hypothetical protein
LIGGKNPKSQAPNPKQIPNSNDQNKIGGAYQKVVGNFEQFYYWDFDIDLVFGF